MTNTVSKFFYLGHVIEVTARGNVFLDYGRKFSSVRDAKQYIEDRLAELTERREEEQQS